MATNNNQANVAGQIPGNPPLNAEGYSKDNPPKASDTPTTIYNGVPPIYEKKVPGFTPSQYKAFSKYPPELT